MVNDQRNFKRQGSRFKLPKYRGLERLPGSTVGPNVRGV